jgi:polyribonucleotide nucleotidyltransferase
VSEVLESNGSSSMATVCASSMSLMNAGVPVKKQVAGIAMGLIQEDGKIAILSDILGDEDHLGDMDFKVVGTRDGITAIQMDMKVQGLSREILEKALEQARQGRLFILNQMDKAIKNPRLELSKFAPRIIEMKINEDRLKDVIGPGGKIIRGISEATQCTIDIGDQGNIIITGPDLTLAKQAQEMIKKITQEPEVNQVYQGTVKKIADFGLFVEILPNTEGLLHVSELKTPKGTDLNQFYKEGQKVEVRCAEINNGKYRLVLSDSAITPTMKASNDQGGSQGGSQGGNQGYQASQTSYVPQEPITVGKRYEGEVKKVMDYGLFIGLQPNQDGLLHISQLGGVDRQQIHQVYREGQKLKVEVSEITPAGKTNVSLVHGDQKAQNNRAQAPKAPVQHAPVQQAQNVPSVPYPQYQPQQPLPFKQHKQQPKTIDKPLPPKANMTMDVEIEEDSSGVQVGQVYIGIVKRIIAHGVFVELAPGIEGLVHISELADHRVANIEDIVEVGEQIYVKCIAIAKDGKIKLSRREALIQQSK